MYRLCLTEFLVCLRNEIYQIVNIKFFQYVRITGLATVLESFVFITACSNHGNSSPLGCLHFVVVYGH
jgi:hypothetical protein